MPEKFICKLSKSELENLYIEKENTLEEMCKIVGCKSPITMSKILNENGISTNRNERTALNNRNGMSDEEFKSFLINEYKEKSIRKIASELGVTQVVIRRYFEKYGIKFKTKSEAFSGKGNSRWKGGRNLRNGYIEVYSPNHPMKNKRNCVYEHDLVMEAYLGRYLKPGEVVHHIDGCKTNNDIRNLVLFSNNIHVKLHNYLKQQKRE